MTPPLSILDPDKGKTQRGYPIQNPDEMLCWNIQVDFYRKGFAFKIIHDVEGPKTSAKNRWASSGSVLPMLPVALDCGSVVAAFPYDKNSVLTGNKFGVRAPVCEISNNVS